jgi:iron(II)-dependent oxidoreductase
LQSCNAAILEDPPAQVARHPLMQDDYLLHFLIQHYSQHFETMVMALTQLALAVDNGSFTVDQPMEAVTGKPETCQIDAGHYQVGGRMPVACDNELPAQQATLGPYAIAVQPVTNGEYLAFMEAGGYLDPGLWTAAGQEWLQQSGAAGPDHWRRNPAGDWYAVDSRGPYPLTGEDVLHGICWHEAQAYARWADAHLPHEHQWEVACHLQRLEQTGRAWEWCDNSFYPYDGFRPFPYEEYSAPWFDGNHYSLRGGSLHTRPAIKRPAFRNFYQPDKRHIFAGLRLVY